MDEAAAGAVVKLQDTWAWQDKLCQGAFSQQQSFGTGVTQSRVWRVLC